MNRLYAGGGTERQRWLSFNPRIERKRWLTRGAPRSSLSSEDAAIEDASRAKQIAKELKRGFSAPEALGTPHPQSRNPLLDLSGNMSADYFSRLPGGLIAARGALAIAAAHGSAELRRCHAARITAQKKVPPVLANARIAKKPRLCLSPTASRPLRVGNKETITKSPVIRIPRSKPVQEHNNEPSENEDAWLNATLAALLDDDLSASTMGEIFSSARTLTIGKPDCSLSTSLLLPRELVPFKRTPFRHSRDFVKDVPITNKPRRAPENPKKVAVVNLVESPQQKPVQKSSLNQQDKGHEVLSVSEPVRNRDGNRAGLSNPSSRNVISGCSSVSVDVSTIEQQNENVGFTKDALMEDVELGFAIRKGAPLSNLQMYVGELKSFTEGIEEAKGSAKKQDKVAAPKIIPRKSTLARKLLQRRKSIDKKQQKSIHRRQNVRRNGVSLGQKSFGEVLNGGRVSTGPEETIARSRPRRKSSENGRRIIIDASDGSSESSSGESSSSSPAEVARSRVRARRQSIAGMGTTQGRRSPKKSAEARKRIVEKATKDMSDGHENDKRKSSNGVHQSDVLKEEAGSSIRPSLEETQSSEQPKPKLKLYSDGFQCIKSSGTFVAGSNKSPYVSSSEDEIDNLEDMEKLKSHMEEITVTKLLSEADKRTKSGSVFGLPEKLDDDVAMVARLSKQHDLFSDDESTTPRTGKDSLASIFATARAAAGKVSRVTAQIKPDRPKLAVSDGLVSDDEVSPLRGQNGSEVVQALDEVDRNVVVSDEESPEEKAKDLQNRVCGDMIGAMSAEDKQKVMQWAIRDFSWFEDDVDLMEVTLRVSGVLCERCTMADETMGPCEESIVLKLWRDMTWRKVRRLRHVSGNES